MLSSHDITQDITMQSKDDTLCLSQRSTLFLSSLKTLIKSIQFPQLYFFVLFIFICLFACCCCCSCCSFCFCFLFKIHLVCPTLFTFTNTTERGLGAYEEGPLKFLTCAKSQFLTSFNSFCLIQKIT